jgi:hypothetical protein
VAVPSLVVVAAAAVVVAAEIEKELAWVMMILNSVELVVGHFH